jgi:hypothetical protein
MKRHPLHWGLLVVLLWGSLGVAACSEQPGTVEGTVTRIEGGQAVAEGQVAVFALNEFKDTGGLNIYEKGDLVLSENLDENGGFSISLPPGDYVIEAWVPEVAKATNQIRVRSGRVTTVHLQVKTPAE